MWSIRLTIALVVSLLFCVVHCSNVAELTLRTAESEIGNTKVTFVNFYADWCRFSQMLKPIFEQAADILKEEFPSSQLRLARIDCDEQQELCQQYHVSKYPTLKLFRNGKMTKREFRGQRTVDGLSKFCRENMESKITEFHQLQDLKIEESKRNIIGYYETKEGKNFETFQRVADHLRDDCQFFVGFGDASLKQRQTGDNVVFKSGTQSNLYGGTLTHYELFKTWASDKCVPLVREITFKNAEEITEEGIPFLLLFHHPDDKESKELYSKTISTHFLNQKGTINFLTADGIQFSHPLHHLGKSANDLPLIAIDSFRHMYTFPKFEDIRNPDTLAKFLADFQSGKLHREFHHGPDATETPKVAENHGGDNQQVENQGEKDNNEDQQARNHDVGGNEDRQTDPPETVFRKLGPSNDRYTLLKDEL